jgi:hypothetical protein
VNDVDHEVAMAEHTLLSVSGDILLLALDPMTRDKLDAKDIGRAIERLNDALILKNRELAA